MIDGARKLRAKIRQAQIVVRNSNRIDHLSKNGQCSSQDYFEVHRSIDQKNPTIVFLII